MTPAGLRHEQLALGGNPCRGGEPPDLVAGRHHSMTGNDEREAVASEGPSHGAGSTGRADPIGELPIGDGAAGRNAAGADVHTSLEVSDGRDVERHVDKRIRVSACNQALYSLQHVDDLRRRYRQSGAGHD